MSLPGWGAVIGVIAGMLLPLIAPGDTGQAFFATILYVMLLAPLGWFTGMLVDKARR